MRSTFVALLILIAHFGFATHKINASLGRFMITKSYFGGTIIQHYGLNYTYNSTKYNFHIGFTKWIYYENKKGFTYDFSTEIEETKLKENPIDTIQNVIIFDWTRSSTFNSTYIDIGISKNIPVTYRKNIDVGLNISLVKQLIEEEQVFQIDKYESIGYSRFKNGYDISPQVYLRYNYQFSPHLHLFAMPNYRYYFKWNKHQYGIDLGIGYTFKKKEKDIKFE